MRVSGVGGCLIIMSLAGWQGGVRFRDCFWGVVASAL